MMSHPNRSRGGSLSRNPTPEEVRAAREAAGLSQTAAAALIHCALRGWQEWEAGNRRMHPAFWELFRIKVAS
jgi:DNA-binding transcriptional regulator YiaG